MQTQDPFQNQNNNQVVDPNNQPSQFNTQVSDGLGLSNASDQSGYTEPGLDANNLDSPSVGDHQKTDSPQINWDEIFAQLEQSNPELKGANNPSSNDDQNTQISSSFTQDFRNDQPDLVGDYVNAYNPDQANVAQQQEVLSQSDMAQPAMTQPTATQPDFLNAWESSSQNTPQRPVVEDFNLDQNDSWLSTPPSLSQDVAQDSNQQQVQPTMSINDGMNHDGSSLDESLESQNIFELLGVNDGTDEEKEQFLDELQQVIWEDFLENDVALLVTEEEKKEVDQILAKSDVSELEKQEEMVVYLEKLVPDLEEIMLEKALDLKRDLYKERIAGFKEYYAGNEQMLAEINRAESLMLEGKWQSSAQVMNQVK